MEPEAPAPAGTALEVVLRNLRDAVELREAEHARRNRNRVLFSRAVILYSLGIVFGLVMLGRVFDPQVFKERLYARLQTDAPVILNHLRSTLTDLAPVYREEVVRSLPTFSESLGTAISTQAEHLIDATVPLATGEVSSATEPADLAFAQELLDKFGPELGQDRDKALTLARAFRAEELKGGRAAAAHELGGSLITVGEISDALKGLGPPDKNFFQGSDAVDSLGTVAMELVKTRLMSGQLGLRGPGVNPPQDH